jgi:hypothetical protein
VRAFSWSPSFCLKKCYEQHDRTSECSSGTTYLKLLRRPSPQGLLSEPLATAFLIADSF